MHSPEGDFYLPCFLLADRGGPCFEFSKVHTWCGHRDLRCDPVPHVQFRTFSEGHVHVFSCTTCTAVQGCIPYCINSTRLDEPPRILPTENGTTKLSVGAHCQSYILAHVRVAGRPFRVSLGPCEIRGHLGYGITRRCSPWLGTLVVKPRCLEAEQSSTNGEESPEAQVWRLEARLVPTLCGSRNGVCISPEA